VAELLVDRGARLEARMEGGATPLMVACGNGRTEAVRWLLERGADRSARDDRGETAAGLAGRLGYPEIQALLDGWAGAHAGGGVASVPRE
jgi:ankyrin repeat protein